MFRFLLLLSILLGMALRCVLITQYPFREDEAVYGAWALHFLFEDPLFLTVWPDKPPIFIWLLSGAFWLFGVDEFSARWLNIGVSVLTVPIVTATARRLWGYRAGSNKSGASAGDSGAGDSGAGDNAGNSRASDGGAGAWAAMAMALSPFAISFAPTGYTDPVLVFCGSVALYFATAGYDGGHDGGHVHTDGFGRWRAHFWAGVWLGLAIMTKQQGLLYVPLVVGCTLVSSSRNSFSMTGLGECIRRRLGAALWLLGGLLLVIGPLTAGDSLRWEVAPSPWDLSVGNYGRLAIVPFADWMGRVIAWSNLGWYLVGSAVGWLALTVGATQLMVQGWVKRRRVALISHSSVWNWSEPEDEGEGGGNGKDREWRWRVEHVWLLWLWALGFLLLHVVTSVQVWDRYLLPLAPILALLIGRLLGGSAAKNWGVAGAIFVLLLVPAGLRAARGEIPIGGDHGGLVGLHDAIDWFEVLQATDEAEPIVLYHQSLGPQYRFYLYESVRRGQVELRWYPHATYLVDNVVKTPHRRKFLLEPDWAPIRNLEGHGAARQVEVNAIKRFGRFRLMALMVNQPGCEWCVCREVLQTPFRASLEK